ncbi:hypothetical protein [Anaerococcus sp. mt242]|uniref:hypothetical protein n=1 Tax=unclassified Anaerococcus TaxID=2614126 RepID=UPI001934319C|nr:hypothetical protein [Anaerococcus sp. mt242]MBM0046308.1 hypothetical protein [Anaerococcus sp. mt242]
MDRRFERTLSQILSVVVLIVFLITIVSANFNIWLVSYIWAAGFIIAWALMLIFGVYVLFQKKSYGMSIFVAILTALGFAILSVPAILVLARFIPGLPAGLTFNNQFLNSNSQLVLYTVLIVVYFAHIINASKLKNKNAQYIEYSEAKEEDLDENLDFNKNLHSDSEIEYNITKDTDEKLVFEADSNENSTYNTEEVILVEDLTDEDLEFRKDEENNG